MTIIQVNVVFGQGSTGKIAADIDARLQAEGLCSVVCYGRKEAPRAPAREEQPFKFCTEAEAAVHKIANRAGALMYGGNAWPTRRLIGFIRRRKPDVVHLHCINGYCVNIYRLLRFLAKERIPTVVTHHAEFFYTGNCGHALDCRQFMEEAGCRNCPRPRSATGALWSRRASTAWRRMRDAVQSFERDKLVFTAVSPWVRERSLHSPIVAGYECVTVENGLDTAIFRPTPLSAEQAERWPSNGRRCIVHVTASFSDESGAFKGGDRIVELARRMPDCNFIVVASYSRIVGQLPANVTLWGRAASQTELAALYSAADLTVIASKRETFSMIVAESLCCGTPVAGFEAGGPESIALPDFTAFVSYGDIDALQSAAASLLARRFEPETIAAQAHRRYSKEQMFSGYRAVYQRLLKQ